MSRFHYPVAFVLRALIISLRTSLELSLERAKPTDCLAERSGFEVPVSLRTV
jgi:hypothetical protein